MSDAADPAVAAIILADTLLAQYREIVVRLEPQVTFGNTEGMAREIPEANRVYAGAWEQLEHARAELASRGIETRAFDLLRKEQGATTRFGVLDSTSSSGIDPLRSLAAGGLAVSVNTMVQLNTAGEAAAHAASAALKNLLPVDWTELARRAHQPHVELRGTSKTVGVVLVLVMVAGLLATLLWACPEM